MNGLAKRTNMSGFLPWTANCLPLPVKMDGRMERCCLNFYLLFIFKIVLPCDRSHTPVLIWATPCPFPQPVCLPLCQSVWLFKTNSSGLVWLSEHAPYAARLRPGGSLGIKNSCCFFFFLEMHFRHHLSSLDLSLVGALATDCESVLPVCSFFCLMDF